MKTKKIISLLLAVVMIAGVLPMSASAFSIDDAKAVIVDATENFVKTAKDAANADLVRVAADQMNAKNVETVKEILDNGTDVFVEGSDLDAITEELNGSASAETSGGGVIVGAYISADGNGYKVNKIAAVLVGDNANDPVTQNQFSEITADDFLDYDELVAKNNQNVAEEDCNADGVAVLQAADFGLEEDEYYAVDSLIMFLVVGGKNYRWQGSTSTSCVNNQEKTWEAIASVLFVTAFCNHGTKQGYDYDAVYCNYSVSPQQDYSDLVEVIQYKVYMSSDHTDFIQKAPMEDTMNSTNSTQWVTINTSESTSVPIPLPSYSWNPNGQKVVSGTDDIDKIWWQVTPAISDSATTKDDTTNGEHYIAPAVLGKTHTSSENTTINVGITSAKFRISGKIEGFKRGDIIEINDELEFSVTIKNHKKIGSYWTCTIPAVSN